MRLQVWFWNAHLFSGVHSLPPYSCECPSGSSPSSMPCDSDSSCSWCRIPLKSCKIWCLGSRFVVSFRNYRTLDMFPCPPLSGFSFHGLFPLLSFWLFLYSFLNYWLLTLWINHTNKLLLNHIAHSNAAKDSAASPLDETEQYREKWRRNEMEVFIVIHISYSDLIHMIPVLLDQ